jgi:beta-lactamase regulating signal transducer with metallopeptidase domain
MISALSISVDNLQLLVDLALKSIVIMLAALALSRVLGRAPASVRHFTWTLAICGLLALPVLITILPGWRAPLLPALGQKDSIEELKPGSAIAEPIKESPPVGSVASLSTTESIQLPAVSPAVSTPDAQIAPTRYDWTWTQLILLVWLTGVIIVLARVVTGAIRVRRIVRQSQYVIDYHWGAMVRRLGGQLKLPDHIALLKSQYIAMPLTWGVWNPVVLLPEEADQWSAEWRRIVLLHELAHIKRRDCLTQLLAQIVCAIYWFNPFVWVAARRLRIEREIACDDYVLRAGTKASDYAKYLLELAGAMSLNGPLTPLPSPAAAGIACTQLESRVRSILDPVIRRNGLNRKTRYSTFALAACLIIPISALQPWSGAASPPVEQSLLLLQEQNPIPVATPAPVAAPASVAPPTSVTAPAQVAVPVPITAPAPVAFPAPVTAPAPVAIPAPLAVPASITAPAPVAVPAPASVAAFPQSEKEGSGLTVETIIQMKMHGVTPEFIESMRRAGFGNLTVRELVKLRMHGVNEEYIKETQKASNEKLTIDDIVELKMFGVTSEYAREMKNAGYDLPLKSLKKMRMFGVTPAYIETLRKLGYTNLTAEQITKMKMHGVNEVYLKEMRDAGFDKLNVEEITRMRMFGVNPAYVKEMRGAGYDNLNMDQLTKMRMHGVTPAFVKEMRDAGFDKLTVEQLIKLRMFGVTADYVNKMRAAGLKNVSLNDLIKLKMHGVDQILLKN